MRSTAPTPAWPGPWRPAASATCWPSPATGGCRPMRPPRAPPRSSPPSSRNTPGRSARPAPARTARAATPGPGWRCIPAPRRRHDTTPPATGSGHRVSGHCWWAATFPPASCPSIAATPRPPTTLAQLITVAGRRWSIEESFQSSKGLAGLDEHQVRRWTPWRRWTLLAMLAHALLAVLTAAEREHSPADPGLIELTCAEVRRLLTAALAPLTAPVEALAHA